MHITLVQFDIHWLRWKDNLSKVQSLIQDIPRNSLVILPEMFTTGFVTDPLSIVFDYEEHQTFVQQWMIELSQSKSIGIVGSIVWRSNHQFYNRLLYASVDGNIQHYDKVKLFSLSKEKDNFTSGTSTFNFIHDRNVFRPLICYDLRFSPLCLPSQDYQVLIYCANWPQERSHHWLTLLRSRAIENQCYVIGVNRIGTDANKLFYCGDSVVFDYDGKKLVDCQDKEGVSSITLGMNNLDKYRRHYPFIADQ